MDDGFNIKISDFGLARVKAATLSTMTGVCGTLAWMSPEVSGTHADWLQTAHLPLMILYDARSCYQMPSQHRKFESQFIRPYPRRS